MENDKTAVEDFLGQLDKSEQPFPEEKVEEKKEEVVEEEKPLPYHEDPKLQRYIDKTVERRLKEIQPNETKKFIEETKSENEDLVKAFTTIVGNDTPEKRNALDALDRSLKTTEKRATEKAIAHLEDIRQKELEIEQKDTETVSQGLEVAQEILGDLSSNAPLAKKLRNDFIDFATRVATKNDDGSVKEFPDFEQTARIFKEMKQIPQSTNRSKELASRSMARSSDASNAPAPKGNTWRDVEREFSKLGK